MALEVGQPAPDFTLDAHPGEPVTLSALKGKPVVLYFYPRDNTPGCTTESCDFNDRLDRVQAKGAVVLGISRDSLKSHAKFADKYDLNFPLLSDPETTVHQAYGAWGEKVLYGKRSIGVIRTTVLIDADGNVAKVWPKVRVKGHADKVVEALEAL